MLPEQHAQHARVLAVGVDAGVARDLGAVHQLSRLVQHDPEPRGGLRGDSRKVSRTMKRFASSVTRSRLVGLCHQAVPDREVIRMGDVVQLAQHGFVAEAQVDGRGFGDRDEAPGREPARGLGRACLALEQAVVGRVVPGDGRDHDRRRDQQRERRAREAAPGRAPDRRGVALGLFGAAQPGSRADPDEQQRQQQQRAAAVQRAQAHQQTGDAPGRETSACVPATSNR